MYLFYGIDWLVPDYQLASSPSLKRLETYFVFNPLLKEFANIKYFCLS